MSAMPIPAPFTGGAVTTPIILPADPTLPLQAATKHYADAATAAVAASIPAQAGLNRSAAGVSVPHAWPTLGSVVAPSLSSYSAGTYLENVPGWSNLGAIPGSITVNASGGLDFSAPATDQAYVYNSGYTSHYIEGTIPTSAGYAAPLAVRVIDKNNYIYMRANATAGSYGGVQVGQIIGGVNTYLYEFGSGTSGVVGYTYKLEARADNSWHVYCNGVELPNGFNGSISGTTLTVNSVFGGVPYSTATDGDGWNIGGAGTYYNAGGTMVLSGQEITGPKVSPGTTVVSQVTASCTSGSISGTTLTLGGTITGNFATGVFVSGSGVTAYTEVLGLASGTANTVGATYTLSQSSSVSGITISTTAYIGGPGVYTVSQSQTVPICNMRSKIPAALNGSTNVGMVARSGGATANAINAVQVYGGPVLHGAATGAWPSVSHPPAISGTNALGQAVTWVGAANNSCVGGHTGFVTITQINHVTGQIDTYPLAYGSTIDGGDLHSPAIPIIRPDGRVLVFYCAHEDTVLRWRLSVAVGDISAGFSAEQTFCSIGSASLQYPAPAMLANENNTIWIVSLGCTTANVSPIIAISSVDLATIAAATADGGAAGTPTWSSIYTWMWTSNVSGTVKQTYSRICDNGADRIDIAVTDQTTGSFTDVRHFYYKAGALWDSNGVFLASATAPLWTATSCTVAGSTLTLGGTITGSAVLGNVIVYSGGTLGETLIAGAGTSWTLSTSPGNASGLAVSGYLGITDLTPVGTSGAPDNLGPVLIYDIARNASTGLLQIVFAQITGSDPVALTGQYYWYAWKAAADVVWHKTLIPGVNCGTLFSNYVAQPNSTPGICLDATRVGVMYAGVGNYQGCAMVEIITPEPGVTFTQTPVSPGFIAGARWTGEHILPIAPKNASLVPVLWLAGSAINYLPTAGAPGYALEIMYLSK